MYLDRAVLAEQVTAVERHLDRVAKRLPADPSDLAPWTDASDAVVLHLWQAIQIVIDLALNATVRMGLGTPETFADAFRTLHHAGVLPADLAGRLVKAAGFRDLIVHAFDDLDMGVVYRAARAGPEDLRAFLGILAAGSTPAGDSGP
ncbi:DUF86 domain-containing protein [Myxococcota bacterium]|nr:DUF86 domain-containing protein [Myxococcota bacterium]